jgi:hypothetical protein
VPAAVPGSQNFRFRPIRGCSSGFPQTRQRLDATQNLLIYGRIRSQESSSAPMARGFGVAPSFQTSPRQGRRASPLEARRLVESLRVDVTAGAAFRLLGPAATSPMGLRNERQRAHDAGSERLPSRRSVREACAALGATKRSTASSPGASQSALRGPDGAVRALPRGRPVARRVFGEEALASVVLVSEETHYGLAITLERLRTARARGRPDREARRAWRAHARPAARVAGATPR